MNLYLSHVMSRSVVGEASYGSGQWSRWLCGQATGEEEDEDGLLAWQRLPTVCMPIPFSISTVCPFQTAWLGLACWLEQSNAMTWKAFSAVSPAQDTSVGQHEC